jgi:hypothetical protein
MKIKQQIKHKIEKFKTSQSYEQKYLNDPKKLEKYKKINKNKSINNAFIYPNSIQTNQFDKISNRYNSNQFGKISNNLKHEIKAEIFDPELEQIFNKIEKEKSYQNQTNIKNKTSVKFNPIVQNPETKYKLYHDSLFRTKPAQKLIDSNRPLIDQTISQNIMAYMNEGTETVYQDSLDIKQINSNQINPTQINPTQINPTQINIKKTKGRTIK